MAMQTMGSSSTTRTRVMSAPRRQKYSFSIAPSLLGQLRTGLPPFSGRTQRRMAVAGMMPADAAKPCMTLIWQLSPAAPLLRKPHGIVAPSPCRTRSGTLPVADLLISVLEVHHYQYDTFNGF